MSTFKLLYHSSLIDKSDTIDYVNIVNNNKFIHNKMNNTTSFLNYTSSLIINMKEYNKFEILKMFIMNPYIDKLDKELFIDHFCKIQKLYNTLNRFIFHYKYNSAKIANDRDLCYNNIHENQARILSLYVKNTKYIFSISDLKNIINNSLYNCEMMFSLPLSIKNPYDNTPFSKANLYNIYFFFKHNDIVIPTIYHLYFMSNFHINKFQKENEVIIRNYLIDNYLKLNTKSYIVKQIKKMLLDYNYKIPRHKILISNEMPDDMLYNTFKEHIKLYYKYHHTLDLSIQENARHNWTESLKKFKRNNPTFGRKIIKYDKILKTKTTHFKEADLSGINIGWFKNDNNSHLDHTYTTIENDDEESNSDEENYDSEGSNHIPQRLSRTHIRFHDMTSEIVHSIPSLNYINIIPPIYDSSNNDTDYIITDNSIQGSRLFIETPNRVPSVGDSDSDTEDSTIIPVTHTIDRIPTILNRPLSYDCVSDDNISSDNDSYS